MMKTNLLPQFFSATQKVTANALLKPFQKYLLAAFLMLSSVGVWGQTTIYSENMGTTATGNPLVTAFTGWQNGSPIVYTGTGDVRTSSASTGYTGASGSDCIFFAAAAGRTFIVSGIDTSGANPANLQMTFGYASSQANKNLSVETSIDGGTTWKPLATVFNANTSWTLKLVTSGIPSSSTLSLKFTAVDASSGGLRIDDVQLVETIAMGKTSIIGSGNWNTAETWSPLGVPTDTDVVTIPVGSKVYNNVAGLVRKAVTNVNGTFQIEQGSWVDSGTGTIGFTYGSTGTLIFNNSSGFYGVNTSDRYWPTGTGPFNVSVINNGGITMNTSRTVAGTFQTAAGVALNSANLTLNGIAQINSGGYFSDTPIYNNTSTLIYNGVSSYNVGNEWTGDASVAGAGTPHNVTFTNSSINMPTTARSLAGNLIIGAGSTLNLNGTFGADLNIGGNWNNAGAFNPSNRAVFFRGTAVQTITGTTTFDYLTINNILGVTLVNPIINNFILDFTAGKLTLGANDLTIGSGGTIVNVAAAKYVITNGAGQLKRTVGASDVLFPVGNAAYNPITFNNSGTSDIYGVRVVSTTPAGADPTKTVARQWITTESVAGGSNLKVSAQYNTGEIGTNYNTGVNPFIGHYNGTAYTQVLANLAGTNPFTATSATNLSPLDLTTGTQYFAIGKDNGLISVPAKYVVSNITPTSPLAGSGFSATITAQDAYNFASVVGVNSGFTLSTNGNAGIISGATTGTINSGSNSVVLTGIILPNAGIGVTLTATNSSGLTLTAGTSAPFIVLGLATKLSFAGVPTSGTAGTNLSSFTVRALRTDDTVNSNFTGTITLAKSSGTGNLSGTVAVAAVAGVATFNSVQFDAADTYAITASATGLTSDMSGNIVISPNPANAYFRSNAVNGNWNIPASWESSADGSTGWAPTTLSPTSAANVVTVRNGNTIKITANVNIDQVVIESGGVLQPTVVYTVVDGVGDDVIVKNGGILKHLDKDAVAGFGTGLPTILFETGAINFAGASGAINGTQSNNYIYENASILEYNFSTNAFNTSVNLFPNADTNTIPIFKISSNPSNVGGGSAFKVNGVIEVTGSVSFTGDGIKTFRNGLTGTGSMTISSGNGAWKIGDDGSENVNAELGGVGGSLTLTNKNGIIISPLCYASLTSTIKLGTNTKFIVQSGATFDFGFDNSNNALNIVRVTTPTLSTGQSFDAQTGSTLKITSPDGIVAGSTTVAAGLYTGNVQIGAASSTRIFSSGLDTNYHYIGKANQLTGNGLPTSSAIVSAPSRNVIVEMADDAFTLQATGVQRFNSSATLEIRKGIVVDDPFNNFANSGLSAEKGNLKMTGGRYRLNTSGIQPDLKGVYDLTAGIIDFAKTGSPIQQIRGGSTYFYPHIEVTGKDVYHTSSNINMKPNALFSVKTDGMITATIENAQIISSDAANKATLQIEVGAVFRTAAAAGFYGPVDGLNPSPSVRDNMLLDLKAGSIVDYARSSEGSGLPQDVTDGNQRVTPVPSGYQNLKMSGNGIKTAKGEIAVKQMTNVSSVSATLIVPDYNEITNPVYSVFHALGGINNANEMTGKLILGNDAILMQNANAFNENAVIQVRRQFNLTDDRFDYNFLSSPVYNQDMKSIYGGDASYVPFVTVLNESSNLFVNAKPADYALQARGFAVKEPILDYTGNTAIYKGKPNNGDDISIDITRFASNRGWNLIGNPYPSNLDLKTFYTENGSKMANAEFRFWDNRVNKTYKQFGGQYAGYSYALYNAAAGSNGAGNPAPGGDTGNNSGPLGSISTTNELFRYVKVGQGFMIRAKEIDVTAGVLFKNSQRVTLQPSRGFFGKEMPLDDLFRLQVISSDDLYLTQTVVYFNGGNNEFDIDDSKHPNSSASDAFYSFAGDEKVVINGRSSFVNTDVINLGLTHFSAGTYKIRAIDKVGVFENEQHIYLKDKLLNIITDISAGDYSFTNTAGQFTNRFEILYQPEIVLGADDSKVKATIQIYRDAQDFVIESSSKKITSYELYEMSGRMIINQKTNVKEIRFNAERLVDGAYVLKAELENGEQVTRKIRK